MLGSLLFGEYRQRALGLLLLNPDASFHVRELARLTGTSAGTLHKELTKLTTGGILQRKQIGNQVHYSANLNCPIFDELASILRKTSGLADVLAKALIGLENKIEFAFVFGSVARGLISEQSFNNERMGETGFSALCALLTGARCFELVYGSTDDGLALVRQACGA